MISIMRRYKIRKTLLICYQYKNLSISKCHMSMFIVFIVRRQSLHYVMPRSYLVYFAVKVSWVVVGIRLLFCFESMIFIVLHATLNTNKLCQYLYFSIINCATVSILIVIVFIFFLLQLPTNLSLISIQKVRSVEVGV